MTSSEAKMLEPGGQHHCRVRRLWLPKATPETWCRTELAMVTAVRLRDGGQYT
jgi:hypothetical protein